MGFIDVVFSVFLCYSLYKGLKNGFFIEVASFVALFIGIYIALKFSFFTQDFLQTKVSWDPKYIQIVAFGLTFLLVVIGIIILGRVLTKMADVAQLSWANKLAGAFFSILKSVLFLSVFILFFEKINGTNLFIAQETLDASIFYSPIKEFSSIVYPQIEEIYNSLTN